MEIVLNDNKNKVNKVIRNSSIELLKVIAMLMIALSHSAQRDEIFSKSIVYLAFIRQLGQIGNAIFIICSAFFLIDSNKTKKEKILNIIIDSFMISMIFLTSALLSGVNIPPETIIRQFMPISLGNNWFISCYLLFYIIHHYLNIIIEQLNKKKFTRLIVGLLVYLFLQFLFKNKLYYSYLIGFAIIYFVVAYIKKYFYSFMKNRKINLIVLIISTILSFSLIAITYELGTRFEFFNDKILYWNRFINFIILAIGFSLFNLFNSIKFKNKFINKIASLSLLFYLIHDNMIFRDYIKPILYDNYFKYLPPYLWLFIEGIALFSGGILLGIIYKNTIQRLTKKLSIKISDIIARIYMKFEKYWLEKIN